MIFEKIRKAIKNTYKKYIVTDGDLEWNRAIYKCETIVAEVQAKYNNGWIPCSERLPETNDAVNIVWVNRKPEPYYADIKDKPFTATGHYHKGKWYWYSVVCKDYLDEYGTSDVDEVDEDIDIIAWQPLPNPYIPKEEPGWKESMMNHFTKGE